MEPVADDGVDIGVNRGPRAGELYRLAGDVLGALGIELTVENHPKRGLGRKDDEETVEKLSDMSRNVCAARFPDSSVGDCGTVLRRSGRQFLVDRLL